MINCKHLKILMAVNIKISHLGCDIIVWLEGITIHRNVPTRLHGVIPEHCNVTLHIYNTIIATYHTIYAS
jgi:hypothetical protein